MHELPEKQSTVDLLKSNLFLPWNLEGEANVEYLDFMVRVNDRLMSEEGYVALGGYGSQFKGYSKEGSDFDLLIIREKCLFDGDKYEALDQKIKWATHADVDHKFQGVGAVEYYYEDFLSSVDEEGAEYFVTLSVLAHPLVGHKEIIKELRDKLIIKHALLMQKMPEFAKYNFHMALKEAIKSDLGVLVRINDQGDVQYVDELLDRQTAIKIQERGVVNEPVDIEDIAMRRVALWAKHINSMLGTDYHVNSNQVNQHTSLNQRDSDTIS